MDNKIITRTFILCILASIFLLVGLYVKSALNTSTRIVFCDVGQGDAAYIRLHNKIDILIDAGPDKKVLSCLGRHMPFFDRKIELALLSHPQKDHYGGYLSVVDRYKVDQFLASYHLSTSVTFKKLEVKLTEKRIKKSLLYAGNRVVLPNASLAFLWPPQEVVDRYQASMDPNLLSQVILFEASGVRALFTGDIQSGLVEQAVSKVDILKVPHHGSRNGLTRSFLHLADPRASVISSGRNNSYGHPAPSILALLRASGSIVHRTDLEGDIVFIITEGKLKFDD